MPDVCSYIQSHKCLCISTFGLAIVGHVAFSCARWIINKCASTAQIEHVALPLIKRQPDEHVKEGHGEYVVYTKENGSISQEIFNKAYQVFQKYSPGAIVHKYKSDPIKGQQIYENRYELIKKEIKNIQPGLKIAFIPKVLYEMSFIHECIEEDIQAGHVCSNLKNPNQADWKKRCWHLPRFTDAGTLSKERDEDVRELAYRLNNVIVDKMPKRSKLSYKELEQMTENETNFLKKYYTSGKERSLSDHASAVSPSITFSASADQVKGSVNIKPMGVASVRCAAIIRRALELECSSLAKSSLPLYRGATYAEDSPCMKGGDDPFSLSYGSSLFAGVVHDAGATAYHYMRNQKNAYTIIIPLAQIHTSPFYIPPNDTLRQLHGHGENFHGRSKLWENSHCLKSERHLLSDLSREKFISLFNKYKSAAIQLV